MSNQDVFVEQFAKLFHHYRETLSSEVEPSDSWNSLPAEERNRMIAAARLAILGLESNSQAQDAKRFYAKPGEAEWGC